MCPPHDAATQRVFAPALPSLLPLQPPLSPDSPSDLCEFDDVYRLINIDLRPFFSLSGFKNQTCILTPRRYIMSVGKNKRLSKGYVRNSNSCKTIVVEEVRCDLTCRPSIFHCRFNSKKGIKKNKVDAFARKDWYSVRAPSIFEVKNVGQTLVNRSQGLSASKMGTSRTKQEHARLNAGNGCLSCRERQRLLEGTSYGVLPR